jgi:hypothetical protein
LKNGDEGSGFDAMPPISYKFRMGWLIALMSRPVIGCVVHVCEVSFRRWGSFIKSFPAKIFTLNEDLLLKFRERQNISD